MIRVAVRAVALLLTAAVAGLAVGSVLAIAVLAADMIGGGR